MNTRIRTIIRSGSMILTSGLVMAFVTLSSAACASTRTAAPAQVAASKPTVTYTYRNDDELIQASQQATAFCQQYQTLPLARSFGRDSERNDTVEFECTASSAFAAPSPRRLSSDLAYSFRTDQELLDVSRVAQVFCLDNDLLEMNSNIAVQGDGGKTVTFHCSN